jgi:hypothetical protein
MLASMKSLPLLLAASLLANVTLAVVLIVRGHATPNALAAATAAHASVVSKDGAQIAQVSPATLAIEDPAALRDALRAAGLPEDFVRSIVQARIWRAYTARLRALYPAPDPNRPYWRNDVNRFRLTAEQRAEQRKLLREQQAVIKQVLGASNDAVNAAGDRYGFLPEDKRQQLRQIESDYDDLIGEVSDGMAEFPLKSDQEKLRYLQDEKKRDIEAMLSPAEKEELELRTSPTAAEVRAKYGSALNSEDQYKAVYQLQKTFDDQWRGSPGDPKARVAAQQQLDDQIKAIVGPDAFTQLAHGHDSDYESAAVAVRRLNLPPTTHEQIVSLRTQTAAESARITGDATLSPDQKKQALNQLAATARDQIRTTLGADAADTYLQRSAYWLRMLDNGNSFTVGPNGNVAPVRTRTANVPRRTSNGP